MKLIFKTFVSGEIEMGMFVSVHSTQCEYIYSSFVYCAKCTVYACTLYTVQYTVLQKVQNLDSTLI